MSSDDTFRDVTKQVEKFVSDNEPVEQEKIAAEFGRCGILALRSLMQDNQVSYTVDWKLQMDPRTVQPQRRAER